MPAEHSAWGRGARITRRLRAARAGLGVAMIPDFIARPYLASGELVSLFDDFIAKDRGIYAVYPPGRFTQPKVRAFIDFLARQLMDMGPDNW